MKYFENISDKSVDFIITDPPYFVNEEVSLIRRANSLKYINDKFVNNTSWDKIWKDKDDYYLFMFEVIRQFYRILKPDRHLIMFCDRKDFSFFGRIGEDLGFKFRTPFFWVKTNPVPQARKVSPMKSVEIALWLTKGKSKKEYYNWRLGQAKDVIYAAIPNKQGAVRRHPTQKPIEVGMFFIDLLSFNDEVIFDPFCGSGTFCLGAKLLGRSYIGIEQDKEWYEVAVDRLNKNVDFMDKYREFLDNNVIGHKYSSVGRKKDKYLQMNLF